MKIAFFYILILCLLFTSLSSFSQSRKELEKKRTKLEKEIKKVNTLLFKTKKKKTNALDDLKDLNQKITVRERLIETIELETEEIEKEIDKNKKQLKKYNTELNNLKKDYSAMVVKTHKSKSMQSKTMFLLSSENFYQAYKRIKYMQQYNDFRKKQGEEIIVKTKQIEKLNDSLNNRKRSKERLATKEKKHKEEIEGDKKDQEKLITTIKKQEKKYKRELIKKQKEEKKIAARIDRLIKEAIARSNRNKKKKGTKKAAEFSLNAEEKKLRAKFELNKGSLPWPVKGVVTRKFGVQPHPTFSGISINSPGLHIVAKQNSNAKSIFNGKVLVVQIQSKGLKSVLVQHGNYISAYNNLEKVFVKKGDKIKTGDKLGKIFTNKVTGKTKLSFVLYKNTKRLNPSEWIQ
ncbi:Septal ring factor EnvC, activator of murein hydrolases AmiA and AmiB [Tenacibaculum sp. 190524A02b]|uniref:murein hydrolase activator EnvC family protein n=1 Tax=Tenacibaculum vairaonense TaxID=3137860 RepID=UPI0032B1CAC5